MKTVLIILVGNVQLVAHYLTGGWLHPGRLQSHP